MKLKKGRKCALVSHSLVQECEDSHQNLRSKNKMSFDFNVHPPHFIQLSAADLLNKVVVYPTSMDVSLLTESPIYK